MEFTTGMPGHVKNPQRLTSLPGETISRILIHIDHSDIPTVMLTCKTLYSLIMTRHFWYHRIRRLCKEHFITPPEEELEEYTIAELEQWALQRIRARHTLHTALELRARKLGSLPPMLDSSCTLLLPGGRWLLVFGDEEPVYSFDLDSDDLNQYTLFDPRQVDPRTGNESFPSGKHVWIDYKAPRLSFRFAVDFPDKEDGLYFSWVYTWEVNLVGHGADATLVAQGIATFRSPKETELFPPCWPAFNNRYFIQTPGYFGWEATLYIGILDYSQALGSSDYPLIELTKFQIFEFEPGRRLIKVELINDNILIVFCQRLLFSCIIDSPTSINSLDTDEIDWPQNVLEYSRTCWTPDASIITFTQSDDQTNADSVARVHGLVIPHDRDLASWMADLGYISRGDFDFKLGIFVSLSCDPTTGRLERLGHEWDFTSKSSEETWSWNLNQIVECLFPFDVGIECLPPAPSSKDTLFLFDEDTGRSVHFYVDMMSVVDVASP